MQITREEIEKEVSKHFVKQGEMKGCLKFVDSNGAVVYNTHTVESATDFICNCLNIRG